MSATCFNPRLTSAARRTSKSGRFGSVLMFQSTPHLSGKANKFAKCSIRGIFLFQSTPHLSGKANSEIILHCISSQNVSIHASPQRQGEHYAEMQIGRFQRVSIHASPQRQGELVKWCWMELSRLSFNPRLTSAARRTNENSRVRMERICFNPRLTSAARRTRRLQLKMSNLFKFQSTPHLSGKANLCLR